MIQYNIPYHTIKENANIKKIQQIKNTNNEGKTKYNRLQYVYIYIYIVAPPAAGEPLGSNRGQPEDQLLSIVEESEPQGAIAADLHQLVAMGGEVDNARDDVLGVFWVRDESHTVPIIKMFLRRRNACDEIVSHGQGRCNLAGYVLRCGDAGTRPCP